MASCARPLEQLPPDDPRAGTLADARDALEAVARRSKGLLHFVRSHRRLTKPLAARIDVAPVQRPVCAHPATAGCRPRRSRHPYDDARRARDPVALVPLRLDYDMEHWALTRPFTVANHIWHNTDVLLVKLTWDGTRGWVKRQASTTAMKVRVR